MREAFEYSVAWTRPAELPEEPRIDGAEAQLAALGPGLGARHGVQDEADLGGPEK